MTRYLVVVSEQDPVAREVALAWGTPPATGEHVDGAAIRILSNEALLLRRPVRHIHDERLDLRLPPHVRALRPTLVFPSIHRSERNVPCLTVHPLGNLGDSAEVGGRPRVLVPTDPLRMASALRALAEGGGPVGLSATFEATHHGPELELPAMFVEIGYGTEPAPPPPAVRVLSKAIPHLSGTRGGSHRPRGRGRPLRAPLHGPRPQAALGLRTHPLAPRARDARRDDGTGRLR